MLSTFLIIVLIVLLFGAVPIWPYSRGWGFAPTASFGVLLAILMILILFGVLPLRGFCPNPPTEATTTVVPAVTHVNPPAHVPVATPAAAHIPENKPAPAATPK